MHKISEQGYSDLKAILDHPGYKILVQELENLLEDEFLNLKRERVDDAAPNKIVFAKCKYEGAERFLSNWKTRATRVLQNPG